MKLFKSIILILSILFLFHSIAVGDEYKHNRRTLRGLKGVHVSISLSPSLSQGGLSVSQLRTDIEPKLRLAGINVVSSEKIFLLPGAPILEASVVAFKTGGYKTFSLYAVSCRISLYRLASVRDDNEQPVPIWSTESVGVDYRVGTIRSTIKDMTDKFINAYLSVNPKK